MDVTERKRVTEQLLQSQRLEAVGRLAGGVAHDFNNILTVIRSYCDVILAGLDSPSQLRDDMEEISNAADRAAILTRQLLAFGRRRMNFPQPLSLNDAITGVAPMLRRLVRADTELSLALAPMESSVVADAGPREQVIMNLVVNARDAMPDGGRIVIESRAVRLDDANVDSVSPGALKPGLYALLSVSDTGIGMPPEIRDRIFEPFFTTKEQGKGTGLGLATVHGIVTDAGGDVAVYSEPGVGTTFKVYLPLTDEPACSPTGPATAPMCSGSGETILVAEDEEAVRRVVVHELRRLGYHVLEARTGDEALSVASRCQGPIHLLVTDMIMPGLNGRELAAAARRAHPGLRVLYTSGYSAEILSREDVREPGFAFLEKPFSIGELAREVRAALDGGAAPADRETCSSP
jgi:nitrogen-specific signal transduction histidine kinase/ActR/RegA family two-component response regulator